MENLLTAAQMKDVDQYTIQRQSITSLDLMERAAVAFVDTFTKKITDTQQRIVVICGQGNNGGDGLAIARLLFEKGYLNLRVFLTHFSDRSTADYQQNLKRLAEKIATGDVANLHLSADDIVIDAILGAGLNRPLSGGYEALAQRINQSQAYVVAVDVPTGFKSEGELGSVYNGVRADFCITFQQPKINFFFPERLQALKEFKVVDIGLDEAYIKSLASPWKLIKEKAVRQILKQRLPFSHKGTYGHALMIAGDTETMGAALFCAGACLNTGAGLVSASVPQSGLTALNVRLPEAMFVHRDSVETSNLEKYQSAAIGPGLGVGEPQLQLLTHLIKCKANLVIDADALNLIAENRTLLKILPKQSIITPHVKEFDRLFGAHNSWWHRVQSARLQAEKLQIIIVLKNQYSFICTPSGHVFINTTGNPAMAQGGMGDVLTGMITSFLAQGYTAEEASLIAVFVHGKVGDTLASTRAVVGASNLVAEIPVVLNEISHNEMLR
jgi:NAD(P)H-hydrate epimerase